ncbi:MAG: cupin domain-containing protein, partial [candidate division WOR-3 bacterium]
MNLDMESKQEERSETKWERWEKKRIFVREIAGKYAELVEQLYAQPRVYKSRLKPFKGGPTKFGKQVINPQEAPITQAIEVHIDVLAPYSCSQKHGHMNSAVFYIL